MGNSELYKAVLSLLVKVSMAKIETYFLKILDKQKKNE